MPIVVGGGKRCLPGDVLLRLELLDERRFGNGMVYLRYCMIKQDDGSSPRVSSS